MRSLAPWLLSIVALPSSAALSPESAAKNQPVAPFRIITNIYYVGASDVTSYLIATPKGLILLDGGFSETAPQIEQNIATLGFKLSDVKILLVGHAHPDHAGGLAALKRETGATFAAMAQEVQPLENEGRGTFYRGDRKLFESVHVDRVLHDGDQVELGGVELTTHLTPGHTPGCTTWSMRVTDAGKPHDVVFECQITLPADMPLVNNDIYPGIAADFTHSFAVLHALPCDVFLAEHGSAFSLQDKIDRLTHHASENPFIDPTGYQRYLSQSEQQFKDALAAQQKRE